MILNVNSDASYISSKEAQSRASGHLLIVWTPRDSHSIRLNITIFTLYTILKFFAALSAEAESNALFLNAKETKIIRLMLHKIRHPKPPTPIHCDNATSAGISNGTIKRQHSQSMEMCYFYICDLVKNKAVQVLWHPGQ